MSALPRTAGEQPAFTVLLPVHRPPALLPHAVETVRAQTLSSFELFIIGDGAPEETIAWARDCAARDRRVKVFAFAKSSRGGEVHRHAVLGEANGRYVAHIGDDDLWFPNHLDELEKLLRNRDFGHTLHVAAHLDGSVEALAADLANEGMRRRMLDEVFNRFGDPVAGYRLEAYRRLPEGWVPSPLGLPPDLALWRKFLRRDDVTVGTRMAITALVFWSEYRAHMSLAEREREISHWHARIRDPAEREEIVQAAWKSLVAHGIQNEPYGAELVRVRNSRDDIQAELRTLTTFPGQMQDEIARLTRRCDELQAELANGRQTAHDDSELARMLRSRSWRLTKPVRAVAALARGARAWLARSASGSSRGRQ